MADIPKDKVAEVEAAVEEGLLDWIQAELPNIIAAFADLFEAHWDDAEEVFSVDNLDDLPPHRRAIVEQFT